MQATTTDLQNLWDLQEADRAGLIAKKKIADLPQRNALAELGAKKQQVLEKLASIAKMHESARRSLVRIEDEIEIMTRKRDDTQAKIDAASGDFRAVQSLTRDLGGIAKRLSTLDEEHQAAKVKYSQVQAVKKQVEGAIASLDAQALKIRESFLNESTELKEHQAKAQRARDEIVSRIDPQLVRAYDEAARRGGGIAMARLDDNRCGTCRNAIDANRILLVKREAPLSTCPNCGRLLVIE